jgi:hypothetical protein
MWLYLRLRVCASVTFVFLRVCLFTIATMSHLRSADKLLWLFSYNPSVG